MDQNPAFYALETLDLSVLNAILKADGQQEVESVEEGVQEIYSAVIRYSHNLLATDLNFKEASDALNINNNTWSRETFMNSKGETGAFEILSECSEYNLKNLLNRKELEFVGKDAAIEDLINWSRLKGMSTLLAQSSADNLRAICVAIGIPKSGNASQLVNQISDHFFPMEKRRGGKIEDNAHPDDAVLNGLAFVNREGNRIVSVEFLNTAWALRRLCVYLCNFTSDTSLYTEEWDCNKPGVYNNGEELEEDDSEPEVACRRLVPVFPINDLFLIRSTLELFNSESSKPDSELDWIERRKKKFLENEKKKLYGPPKNYPGLPKFIEWFEQVQPFNAHVKMITGQNFVTFKQLGFLIPSGAFVKATATNLRSTVTGYKVIHSGYTSKMLGNKRGWEFKAEVVSVHSTGTTFIFVKHTETIKEFLGESNKSSMPFQLMDEDLKTLLSLRGEKYTQLSLGQRFVSHGEECFITDGRVHIKSGRMMVDLVSAMEQNKWSGYDLDSLLGHSIVKCLSTWETKRRDSSGKVQSNELKVVPKDLLCLCWPAVASYSFTFKRWGSCLVTNIQEIKWNEKAYDQIVLEERRKKLVRSVVSNTERLSTDIVDGKGGGSIILLHGPPGTGKTLTAEAISEMLHKPLYHISVAELGTTPQVLETKLTSILDLSAKWKCILLIDEADMFVEARGYHEVERNAMVGVMIQKLEYYQGILVLTTNRVKAFDPAFYSRTTVALRYEELDQPGRAAVWKLLLENAGITWLDANSFSFHRLNGRQIKNCISLSQGLAHLDKREVTADDILMNISLCSDFIKIMDESENKC